ncbi:hypothetical protein [Streptococcus macacae]|uniref:Thioredoxin domain-containing protein n=1 Tax=Streptococcus macacae NCTC 11558 TaxID=764298 RepID=G5JXM1_9STRE|nr:hypothetical protein [Streptococcus macacae]EHJ52384.1 hypothetical protein STRMA_1645 [Streptococcus macacae NCTC 11558]SUN77579.1 Uncharacterised protein [Streptococcus macacae NCTC 11558]
MAVKQNLLKGKSKQRFAIVIILLLLMYGAYDVYKRFSFVQKVGSPIELIFKRYRDRPILKGEKQNTPTLDRDLILQKESFQKPVIYCFYKVGCSTCQSNYQAERSAITHYKSQTPFYWVNVDNPVGKKLVKTYGVTRASTITAVDRLGHHQNHILPRKADKETILQILRLLES